MDEGAESPVSNIYAAPNASLSVDDGPSNTAVFARTGRIGRVSWLALGLGIPILIYAAATAAYGLFAQDRKVLSDVIGLGAFALSLLALTVFSRRRFQDFGLGPVNLLLAIIPVLNFYFLFLMIFKRGDDGGNAYGAAPCRNSRAMNAGAVVVCLFTVLGLRQATQSQSTSPTRPANRPVGRREHRGNGTRRPLSDTGYASRL